MHAVDALVRRSYNYALAQARLYARANMTATVTVLRGDESVFDPVTGGTVLEPTTVVWSGVGRVYSVSGPVQYTAGEEPTHYSNTQVSIPITAPRPQVDDTVKVTAHPDPGMVGRAFRVIDVEAGGQLPVVHKMTVSGVQPSPQWTQL